MRHFALSFPPAACPLGVGVTAAAAALVALPGRAQRGTSGHARALQRAVAMSAVTGGADQHLGTAVRTQEQTRRGIHRRLPGQAEEIWTATHPSRNTASSLSCARTGWGTAPIWTAKFRDRCRVGCLHGARFLPPIRRRVTPQESSYPKLTFPPGHCTPSTLTRPDSPYAEPPRRAARYPGTPTGLRHLQAVSDRRLQHRPHKCESWAKGAKCAPCR
jgi:hypothetical protein